MAGIVLKHFKCIYLLTSNQVYHVSSIITWILWVTFFCTKRLFVQGDKAQLVSKLHRSCSSSLCFGIFHALHTQTVNTLSTKDENFFTISVYQTLMKVFHAWGSFNLNYMSKELCHTNLQRKKLRSRDEKQFFESEPACKSKSRILITHLCDITGITIHLPEYSFFIW